MFTPRHIHRSIVVCGLAGSLLASAMTSPAAARVLDPPLKDLRAEAPTSSLAGTTSPTPPQDLRSPDARDAARADEIALAVKRFEEVENVPAPERRYWAYPTPEPLVTAQSQSPAPSDDTPWLPIALSITAGLAVVAASGAQIRRVQVRRRRTAGATT